MKRTRIAAAMTAVAALAVPVVATAPAHALEVVHVQVDPRDWTWSGTITYGCDEPTSVQFTLQPNAGLQHILDFGPWGACDQPTLSVSTLTDGNATYSGQSMIADLGLTANGLLILEYSSTGDPDRGIPITFKLGYLDDVPNMEIVPRMFASDMRANNVIASGNIYTAEARAKNTGYITVNPGRVTAMAKRFVARPGDLINIHGYGPDKDVALARADHVRDHLLSEITRLGGNPDEYPVMVIYAGDPAHKKGVHVTIHQHAASSITVPEGETLTIGGGS